MRTMKTLKPGQAGTKELLTRFGPSLPRVRYRYDEDRREHVKTVELVVQRRSREGETGCAGSRVPARAPQETGSVSSNGAAGARTRRVALRIGWQKRDLQQRVKSAGGRWDPDRRVWLLRRDAAERLDLLARVCGGAG
ncbi:MAG: hypothetical protein GY722_08345 [bacterium]|nr:hypothetical protein [bacterium]